MLGERDGDRRHDVREPDRPVLEHAQEGLEIEARHRDARGAPQQAQVHHHDHAVDMEEGQHANQRPDLGGLDGIDLYEVGEQVAMRQHHAFRQAGGARRVRQHDDVVGRIDGHRRRVGVDGQVVQRGHAVDAIDGDDLDWPFDRSHPITRAGQQRAGRDQQTSACVTKLKGHLLGGIGGVDGGEHGADSRDGMEHHGVLRQVGRVDANYLALADAVMREARGQAANALGQLAVGDGVPGGGIHQRGTIPIRADVSKHEVGERHVGNRDGRERAAKGHGGLSAATESLGIIVPSMRLVERLRSTRIRCKVRR